jgi:hypothetical protein
MIFFAYPSSDRGSRLSEAMDFLRNTFADEILDPWDLDHQREFHQTRGSSFFRHVVGKTGCLVFRRFPSGAIAVDTGAEIDLARELDLGVFELVGEYPNLRLKAVPDSVPLSYLSVDESRDHIATFRNRE